MVWLSSKTFREIHKNELMVRNRNIISTTTMSASLDTADAGPNLDDQP